MEDQEAWRDTAAQKPMGTCFQVNSRLCAQSSVYHSAIVSATSDPLSPPLSGSSVQVPSVVLKGLHLMVFTLQVCHVCRTLSIQVDILFILIGVHSTP